MIRHLKFDELSVERNMGNLEVMFYYRFPITEVQHRPYYPAPLHFPAPTDATEATGTSPETKR